MKQLWAKPLVRVALILALLHLPWPGLGHAFVSYFGAVAPPLLGVWSAPGLDIQLTPAEASSGKSWSVTFDARDPNTGHRAQAELDLRRAAWVPFCVFIALLAGMPIRRPRRRLLVAGIGLALLHLLTLLPFLAFFGGERAGLFPLGSVTHTIAVVAQRALLAPPGMAYAVPALLWFALAWKLEPELT